MPRRMQIDLSVASQTARVVEALCPVGNIEPWAKTAKEFLCMLQQYVVPVQFQPLIDNILTSCLTIVIVFKQKCSNLLPLRATQKQK
jgi:hypothetical protein